MTPGGDAVLLTALEDALMAARAEGRSLPQAAAALGVRPAALQAVHADVVRRLCAEVGPERDAAVVAVRRYVVARDPRPDDERLAAVAERLGQLVAEGRLSPTDVLILSAVTDGARHAAVEAAHGIPVLRTRKRMKRMHGRMGYLADLVAVPLLRMTAQYHRGTLGDDVRET